MSLAELLEEVDVEYFGGELLGEDAADDAATTAANGGDSSSNGGRAEISPEPAYGPNCGACADPTGPPCAHICKRVALEPEHRVRLHNTRHGGLSSEATGLRRVASGECARSDGVVNPLHLAVSVTLRPREIA